jgi:hypothetical protein
MVSSLGAITVLAYRGTTQITSSAGGVLSPNTVYLIEVYFKLGDTDGRWVVKADGVTILDFTGDTNPGLDADFDTIYFGGKTISTFYYGYIDDVRIDNANWIGDTVVLGIAPTGAGATTQWDPSAGANFACVDEVPPSDADYVSTNVNDEIDTYALGDLPVSPPIQSVKCVQVNARARKEGASTPQKIALVVRAGGTDYPSGDKVLTTSFKGHANLWEQNPNTAAAWTESGVNGIEAGVKARA